MNAWERAMGMSGYKGSPMEKEDRDSGLVEGGLCIWVCHPTPLKARIVAITTDSDGAPLFHLEMDEHKPIAVERDEILEWRENA